MFSSVLHSGQNPLGFEETSCRGGPGWAVGLVPAAGPGPGPGGPGCFCGGLGEEGGGLVVQFAPDPQTSNCWPGSREKAPKPKSFPKGCSGGGG